MVTRVTKQSTRAQVLGLLEDLVREWFGGKFEAITEPQGYAVPLIHAGKNVLVSSPTGSGKTLTAFLSIINELYGLQKQNKLEERIYCVYVSPLKALANDIRKNLIQPLEEMKALAVEKGLPVPEIRVGVRSGDTSASERQAQARKPPHIFITTPESLALVITTPVFKERFRDVRWVIVDEIHEVCSNKRGAHLSLTLERLREHCARDFTRIGLSATVAPMDVVSLFLGGYEGDEPRPMHLVEVESRKRLDMRVLCPVKDLTAVPYEVANNRMYDLLRSMIREQRTTLVFTNTRSGTEHVSFRLKERGVEDLEAHHGSLSKEVRLDVEDRLKAGKLKAVICSTSLELGIDIGYIDLVCQIGSPKSIAKGLQRIGRAGHNVGDTSVGRLIVFENDDLVECAALVKNAYENHIDRVDIPRNCLDVLAQAIVGMSLEKKWTMEEAFRVVRRSYSYRDLTREDFNSVLQYLSSRNPDVNVYAKIWIDENEGVFGRKRGSRLIYFTNIGTIAEEGAYHVYNNKGVHLGELSEKFVEHLTQSDIFVLGGRTYQFERLRGMTVFVKDASGRRPTVPSWTGEMLPRSFDLSQQVGALRREILERVDAGGEGAAKRWLTEVCRLDRGSAESMVNYCLEQRAIITHVPTDRELLIEGYIDAKGNRNAIFHFPFGRRTNDALGRAYAHALGTKLGCNVRVSVTDDNFMLTVPKRFSLAGLETLVTPDSVEEMLRRAVRNTELFKQRFRHCATRAFMILRNYRGHEVSVGRQQIRSQKVLDWLHEIDNFPVIKEAYNEILHEVMDLDHAREVLGRIHGGQVKVHRTDFSPLPSPFAHNVVLAGISDIVLMEDRSALLRELHRQVLQRIMPVQEVQRVQFPTERVEDYFQRKMPPVGQRADVVAYLERAGAANLLQEKGVSVYAVARAPRDKLRGWIAELMASGEVQSVWTPQGTLWTTPTRVPVYAAAFARRSREQPLDRQVLEILAKGPKTNRDLTRGTAAEKQPLSDALHRLERGYRIQRTGVEEVRWALRSVDPAPMEASLEDVVLHLLGARGPLTLGELAVEMDLGEDQLKVILQALENRGQVSSGHFVLDSEFQYMLTQDLAALEGRAEAKGSVATEEQVKAHLLDKQFHRLRSLDDYFDTFLEVGMVYDVAQRVEGFHWEEWLEKRRRGEVIEGRFLAGRVRYIRAADAPLFYSAYRREPLGELDKRALDVIAKGDGTDTMSVAQALDEDYERVKEAVDRLDRGLYIVRKFMGTDGWSSRNYYVAFPAPPPVEGAREKLLLAYLRASGPASVSTIKGYLGWTWDEVTTLVADLEGQGKITKIRIGDEGEERYILPGEIPVLQARPKEAPRDRLRILSLLDPWVQPMWAEVTSRFGEGWIFPLVKDGDIVGMVEQWEMSGCIEVRQLHLDRGDLLPEVLQALDAMMAYYRQRGYEVLRVTEVQGKAIPEAQDLGAFTRAGYHRFPSFLAKGSIVADQVDASEVLAHAMAKQGLLPKTRFKDVLEAINTLGGLRSDFEARLRVESARPLERLHRRGFLSKGLLIPEYITYTTEDDLRLYKAAKDRPLDGDMAQVLRLVQASEPVSRRRILELSPLGEEATAGALRRLYKGLHITREEGGVYRSIRSPNVSPAEARKQIIRRLFDDFGVFTAENLAAYTRFEFNMGETRALLRALEAEGVVVKGFLVRGNATLHWILKKDLPRVGTHRARGTFVLSPMDGLHLYLRGAIQAKWGSGYCYVVFRGTEMVAAFKAAKRGEDFTVSDFQGEAEAREVVRRFAQDNNLRVREGPGAGADEEDWEIAQWWEKMYGASDARGGRH